MSGFTLRQDVADARLLLPLLLLLICHERRAAAYDIERTLCVIVRRDYVAAMPPIIMLSGARYVAIYTDASCFDATLI